MGIETKTGLYSGRIMHHRFSPKRHYFTYPVFIFAIDLDEIEYWDKKLKLFGHNRFSLYTLRDGDHTPPTPPQSSPSGEEGLQPVLKTKFKWSSFLFPLSRLGWERGLRGEGVDPYRTIKAEVVQLLRARGYVGPVDQIVLVTQFRVLGYLFNPVSFYYCYSNGVEVAYVAEVGNTFHQKHSYVFFGGGNSYWTEKVFYVSPFLEMDLTYNFRFEPLGDSLRVHVDDYKGKEPVLKTFIQGKCQPLSDWNLLKSFLKIPLMSAWIIGWIHWQALKLWLKKVPLVFRPLDGMKPGWAQTQEPQ